MLHERILAFIANKYGPQTQQLLLVSPLFCMDLRGMGGPQANSHWAIGSKPDPTSPPCLARGVVGPGVPQSEKSSAYAFVSGYSANSCKISAMSTSAIGQAKLLAAHA